MTLGSLFGGSGTCPLAAAMCGITPVWASEIEPYPIRVTQKNFPRMKHLGDITQINGAEIEPVDIVTFGSPCQDLSVAGTQKGLIDGKRSSLFFEAIRIIMEMREATHGSYIRHGDEDIQITDFCFNALCPKFGCTEFADQTMTSEEQDQLLSDCVFYGCPVATVYAALSGYGHLRDRLRQHEDAMANRVLPLPELQREEER